MSKSNLPQTKTKATGHHFKYVRPKSKDTVHFVRCLADRYFKACESIKYKMAKAHDKRKSLSEMAKLQGKDTNSHRTDLKKFKFYTCMHYICEFVG